MQAWGLQRYRKRDSGTGVFLWILQNFQEHLFYRTPLGDCLYIDYFFSRKILDYPQIINSSKMNERTLNYTWPKLTKYFDIFFTLAPGVGKYSPLQIWRIYRKGWLNEWLVMSLANNTIENTNVGNDPNYEVLLPFLTLSENEVSIPSLFSPIRELVFVPQTRN